MHTMEYGRELYKIKLRNHKYNTNKIKKDTFIGRYFLKNKKKNLQKKIITIKLFLCYG